MEKSNIIAVRPTKTVYRDGQRAVKIFNEGYLKSAILNEALNQTRAEEAGINIPNLIEVTMFDNRWAIISEYKEGKTLEQLMDENPDRIDEYIERFVSLQLSVHNKSAPLLNKLRDKMQSKISKADLDPTTRYELHTRLESMPKHNKVCHGDFCPSNIICGTDGIDYIIDWSHATQGNASADAARTYLLFMLEGKKDIAEKYLKLFCLKSDTARQYIDKWLPIVAASQLVKEKTEEREFLMRWIDVVDYD